ncbi:MAG: hypothetical protein ABJC61_10560 [Acidobacteriota bacterium]
MSSRRGVGLLLGVCLAAPIAAAEDRIEDVRTWETPSAGAHQFRSPTYR